MYDRILVGTDGSRDAEAAVTHAIDLARQVGATLHAVYVVDTRTEYDNDIVDPETVRRTLTEEGKAALAAIERQSGPETPVVTEIREGAPSEELLEYVDTNGIDLVVLGAQGRSAFKTILLGSTTEALLRADEVPVLVVGDRDE
ncbi:universal stress protein [Halorarum halophilum]|uniref:Universal stress protein n=1 Tax=Halorarum halophilum TaxID=2743090 RepID=A0A7D5GMD1_9EURY|nr:universal stress protein [Halobaculum halophilum]QLG28667.1 universal stress protein [Halobaculum halophilum]